MLTGLTPGLVTQVFDPGEGDRVAPAKLVPKGAGLCIGGCAQGDYLTTPSRRPEGVEDLGLGEKAAGQSAPEPQHFNEAPDELGVFGEVPLELLGDLSEGGPGQLLSTCLSLSGRLTVGARGFAPEQGADEALEVLAGEEGAPKDSVHVVSPAGRCLRFAAGLGGGGHSWRHRPVRGLDRRSDPHGSGSPPVHHHALRRSALLNGCFHELFGSGGGARERRGFSIAFTPPDDELGRAQVDIADSGALLRRGLSLRGGTPHGPRRCLASAPNEGPQLGRRHS